MLLETRVVAVADVAGPLFASICSNRAQGSLDTCWTGATAAVMAREGQLEVGHGVFRHGRVIAFDAAQVIGQPAAYAAARREDVSERTTLLDALCLRLTGKGPVGRVTRDPGPCAADCLIRRTIRRP